MVREAAGQAALPRLANARQVRVLATLETFPADTDGWRKAGRDLLIRQANVDRATFMRARDELIEAKLVEYQEGRGKGVLSQWKILIPPLDKGSPAEPFSGEAIRVQPPRQKGSARPLKGFSRKPDNSANNAGQTPDFAANGQSAALSAKAEALKAEGFSSAEPAGPAVAAAPAGGAAAATHIPGTSLSELCRAGQHGACTWWHCRCGCHERAPCERPGDAEPLEAGALRSSPFRKQFKLPARTEDELRQMAREQVTEGRKAIAEGTRP